MCSGSAELGRLAWGSKGRSWFLHVLQLNDEEFEMVGKMRKLAMGAVAAGLLTVATAASAQAADQDAFCNSTELCFYYNSYEYGLGSMSDFDYNRASLDGYRFLTGGAGQGQYVKNNAGAALNNYCYAEANVYYNSNYVGSYDTIGRCSGRDLVYVKNENASFKWI